MKQIIFSTFQILILLAFKRASAQQISIGIGFNKAYLQIPKVQEYERKYLSKPNLDINLNLEMKKWCVSANAGRQINTLVENNMGEKLSVWAIENEKKVRTQNYIDLALGGTIFSISKFDIIYLLGIRAAKSIKTFYWREAVNKKTMEFTFYDKKMKANYCVKQELIMTHNIFKGMSLFCKIGLINNIRPFDEWSEYNVVKNDYRWAFYFGGGLAYGFDFSNRK